MATRIRMVSQKAQPANRPRGLSDRLSPYLYIAPAFAVYAVFFLYPLVHLVQLSTIRWIGVQPKVFVGLDNYIALFTSDDQVLLALEHNLIWWLAALIVPVAVGLGLAILLARTPLHGRLLFRTIYFLPQVLSSVIVAVIWRAMYNPNYGVINGALNAIGLGSLGQAWLGESDTALPALFIAWSWIYYGFCMVIFLAALQSIDESYFDAAKVDGANSWQQIWHIALPAIRRPLSTVILLTSIAAFQVFDIVYITTAGGPANATLVLALHMYENAFHYDKIGYGAAIAIVLGLLISVLSVGFNFARNRLELD